jgi:small subunit ribosomal protein S17
MDKTIVVEVEDRVKHPLYGKIVRRIEGQGATRQHCRHRRPRPDQRDPPAQRTKRWRLVEILEKAK